MNAVESKMSDNVVDLTAYVEGKATLAFAVQAAQEAECARRRHLLSVLTDLLAELEAA